MRKMLLMAVSFLIICSLSAQYTVTKVKGRIKTSFGSYIKPGSVILTTDVLIFSSKNDKVWVTSINDGEKVVVPSPEVETIPGGFKEALKDAIFLDPANISLRAGFSIIEKLPAAILSDNNEANKIVIEQENKFLFDPAVYPQNGDGEFFLQIKTAQARQDLPRRLRVHNDTLLIYYSDFLTETLSPSNSYILGYHKTNSSTSVKVADIRPYFDLTNEMEGIIANTIKSYKKAGITQDSLLIKTYNSVYRLSGKPNGILFTVLFDKYWHGDGSADSITIPRRSKGLLEDDTASVSNIPVLSSLVSTTRGSLPDNFSLRQYAPRIGDQGNYSSCTAWSSAYAARTISYAVSHNYTYIHDSDKIKANTFSPGFVYNSLANDNACGEGLNLYRVLSFISNAGVMTDKGDPFICGNTYMLSDVEKAKTYRIKDFQAIEGRNNTEDDLVFKMKGLLVARHPVIFGMIAPASFDSVDNSGEWRPSEKDYLLVDSFNKKLLSYYPPSHAMCVIGYNDSIADGSFEIMNSWGENAGNKGFYWINYHDFFVFTQRVYSITDFIPGDSSVTNQITVKKKDSIVKPAVTVLVKTDSSTVIAPPPLPVAPTVNTQPITIAQVTNTEQDSPKLQGEMQFMYVTRDETLEPLKLIEKKASIPASKNLLQDQQYCTYSYYTFERPLHLQDQYNIQIHLSQDAYVYVVGANAKNPYCLFPRLDSNESALINVTNATLTLPGDSSFFSIDNKHGTEKMCVLLSKSPINTASLYNKVSSGNYDMYGAVMDDLAEKVPGINVFNTTNENRVDFNYTVTDKTVLALFIEITH